MKDIEFRQAIFKEGKFHHWHYWGYVGHRGEFVAPISIEQHGPGQTYEVKESQQYIRLHCGYLSLGKKIYEGDIIRDSKGRILIVEWSDCYARYMATLGQGGSCVYYLNEPFDATANSMNLEVIGSIWETPELCHSSENK